MARKLEQSNGMAWGFGMFRTCLGYKLARQGKQLITVGRAAPTAKTCHSCGHVNETLTTRDRSWRCPACGAAIAREVNAAQNIRDFGLAQYFSQRSRDSA